MGILAFIRSAVSIGLAIALLAGCGGTDSASPLPIQPMTQRQSRVHATGNGYKLLYNFEGGTDGEYPSGGLTSLKGVLYGLTSSGGGGTYGKGTVFSITPSGTEKVLYRFQGGNDGANPTGGLLLVNGSLYGTTQNGGSTYGYCYSGCGTVFKVSTSGEEQVLYEFQGGNDGYFPSGDLTALHGVLYGTTSNGGGSGCGGHGCGTVFSITAAGTETVRYRFKGGKDGVTPNGQLLALGNVLYGTTYSGGHCVIQVGCGTVFKVTTSGHETVLYRFKGAPYYDYSKDGGNPAAGLLALNGTLYGTTAFAAKVPAKNGELFLK
jgi:uncharacterized repeat protein (TIGR03803 family)